MDPLVHAGIYVVAGLVLAAAAWEAARRRATHSVIATSLMVIGVGGAWWSFADAVVVVGLPDPVPAIATLASYPGIAVTVAAFACLGRGADETGWTPSRRLLGWLSIEPVLVTLAAATNPWLRLLYEGAGAADLVTQELWEHTPWFWVHAIYSYVLLGAGIALIARGWWRSPPVFRRQRQSLLLASVFPVVVNVLNLSGVFGRFGDPTPLGFAVTGGAMGWAIFRQDLIAFAPVARAVLIERISDAVIALSPDLRIIDLNPAAETFLRAMEPGAPAVLIGTPAPAILGPWGHRLEGRVARSDGEPVHLTVELADGSSDLEVRASPLTDGRGREIGVVLVARDVTELNAQRRRLEEQLAEIEALRSTLAEQASRDSLTGLHNRRHLMFWFAPMIGTAAAAGEPLGVVLVDLDLFKSINDEHGHLVGDRVLVAMAERLRRVTPDGGLVARWGGEEFVIVLPGSDSLAAAVVAEDLRRRCEDAPLAVDGRLYPCTVSAGVASFPAGGTSVDALLESADRALYAAKHGGRNAVRVFAGDRDGVGAVVDADPDVGA